MLGRLVGNICTILFLKNAKYTFLLLLFVVFACFGFFFFQNVIKIIFVTYTSKINVQMQTHNRHAGEINETLLKKILKKMSQECRRE